MEMWIISLISSVSTVSLLAILVFLFRTWIAKRIQYSIKHQYDKELAKIEHERDVRLKAELISDLFSEWLSKDIDYQKLNGLTFKAFLWFPPELANELSASLSHKEDAPDVRALINKVRKHLLGENDSLETHKVIVFIDPSTNKNMV